MPNVNDNMAAHQMTAGEQEMTSPTARQTQEETRMGDDQSLSELGAPVTFRAFRNTGSPC
jgi:hypothetical protein